MVKLELAWIGKVSWWKLRGRVFPENGGTINNMRKRMAVHAR